MNRLFPLILTTLAIAILAAGSASATTYYVAANGSDSNNGTAKTSPWLHAPGMPACTGTCASANPQPGDHFIFRGGDTWHYGAGTPAPGGTWSWTWSGTSSNPIYIGVDKTWYSGGAWARPIFTGDNSTSTSIVGSCAHASPTFFAATDQSYVTIDNFEWTGKCDNGSGPNYIWYGRSGPSTGSVGMTASNNYFHGWTLTSGGQDVSYAIQGYADNTGTNPGSTVTGNVLDGSDSYCSGAGACSGGFVYGDCTYVTNNVVNYVANVAVCNDTLVFAGNFVENAYESFGSTHGNVMEWLGYGPSGTVAMYLYNNIVANATIGETIDLNCQSSCYYFNNVQVNNGNGANCEMDESVNGSNNVTIYHFNETADSSCTFRLFDTLVGTWHAENNHYIGYSPQTLAGTYNNNAGGQVTIDNDGTLVFQNAGTECGSASNYYAPTSSSCGTVGKGTNLTSRCSGMAYAPAAAACQAGNATVTYDSTKHVVNIPTPIARPSSGAWDAGAYEFDPPVGPNPPTNLAGVVH